MRKSTAAIGSVVFFAVAPGVVAGLIPWLITRWRVHHTEAYWVPLRVLGVALLVAGAAVLVHSFGRFVVEGLGTPAPVAPPQQLVVGGLYRHVRNPMYVAVLSAIVGQAVALGHPSLLLYAAVVGGFFAGFVHFYEEPTLRRQFGAQYDAYRQAVPAWFPASARGSQLAGDPCHWPAERRCASVQS